MTKEEIHQMEIANCKCCLLAEVMKDCKACKFNHALAEKNNTVSTQGKEDRKMKTFQFYGVDNNCYKLDDKVWEAIEDENDGYRSYLESIEVKEKTDDLIFFSTPLATVQVKEVNDGYKRGWQLEDIQNGHVWLFVGTETYDDYYPCFRFEYTPMDSKSYNSNGTRKSSWELFITE